MKTIKTCLLNSLYLCAYALLSPMILYRRIFRGRSLGNFGQRALGLAPVSGADTQHCVWLHAVSVGEVNLLQPLLDQLKTRYPDSRFVISTTTATGMQLAKQKFTGETVFYFPIDFSWAIKNALRRLRPDVVVLTELEVWPNLISIASGQQVPVVVINGRLGEKSFHSYRKRLNWIRPIFSRLDRVVAQTDEYARRFVQLGCPAERVSVSGSIKFDGATQSPCPDLVEQLSNAIGLRDDDVLWVAGSTQQPEEQMAVRTWLSVAKDNPRLRLVVVPRHPDRGRKIQQQLAELGVSGVLRSQTLSKFQAGHQVARDQVLISDTIGELTAWWSLATLAFMGGSFGDRGGQNMLEPAAAGASVCFGPNTWNFEKIVQAMKQAGIGRQLQSEQQLVEFVEGCLADPDQATKQAAKAREFVEGSQGALESTCRELAGYFHHSAHDLTYRAA